jgi:succinate dehydrogenase/fumarate reductase flavoprotein subunit
MPDVADIVVIGFGGAGAAAAITAHDHGAKVAVIEKAECGGGSTQASGGNIRPIQNVDGAIKHFCEIADQGTPEDVVAALVHGLVDIPEWIHKLGGKLKGAHSGFNQEALGEQRKGSAFPDAVGADALGSRLQVEGREGTCGGERLWDLLEKNVRDRGIPVRLGTPVEKLRRVNGAGRITGVDVKTPSGPDHVEARAGVVLACGGFNWGTEYHKDLFGTVLPALTPPGRNNGDGIRLAQDVGAQLWHMSAVAARFGFKLPGFEAAFKCTAPAQGLFLVDQLGRRFIDETGISLHAAGRALLDREPRNGKLLRCPSFMVFDETTRRAGPIGNQANGYNRTYKWSADNSVEVAKGWIHQADSMRALAEKLGVPADQLERSAADYAEACKTGMDQFGRRAATLLPLTKPFYGIPVWPCLLNTQGGPRRNAKAEVLNAWGKPIEGLYSAGELGSLWGALYPGAGNIGEALVTGRIAVRSALSLN